MLKVNPLERDSLESLFSALVGLAQVSLAIYGALQILHNRGIPVLTLYTIHAATVFFLAGTIWLYLTLLFDHYRLSFALGLILLGLISLCVAYFFVTEPWFVYQLQTFLGINR